VGNTRHCVQNYTKRKVHSPVTAPEIPPTPYRKPHLSVAVARTHCGFHAHDLHFRVVRRSPVSELNPSVKGHDVVITVGELAVKLQTTDAGYCQSLRNHYRGFV